MRNGPREWSIMTKKLFKYKLFYDMLIYCQVFFDLENGRSFALNRNTMFLVKTSHTTGIEREFGGKFIP